MTVRRLSLLLVPLLVNGLLSNLAAFAAAFGCKAGDPIVRDLTRKAVIS